MSFPSVATEELHEAGGGATPSPLTFSNERKNYMKIKVWVARNCTRMSDTNLFSKEPEFNKFNNEWHLVRDEDDEILWDTDQPIGDIGLSQGEKRVVWITDKEPL